MSEERKRELMIVWLQVFGLFCLLMQPRAAVPILCILAVGLISCAAAEIIG